MLKASCERGKNARRPWKLDFSENSILAEKNTVGFDVAFFPTHEKLHDATSKQIKETPQHLSHATATKRAVRRCNDAYIPEPIFAS